MVTPFLRRTYNGIIAATAAGLAGAALGLPLFQQESLTISITADPREQGFEEVLSVDCEKDEAFCSAVAGAEGLEIQHPELCSKDSAGTDAILVEGRVEGEAVRHYITPTARSCDLSRLVTLEGLLKTHYPSVQLLSS